MAETAGYAATSYDTSSYATAGYASYNTAAYSSYSYSSDSAVYSDHVYYNTIDYNGDHDVYDIYLNYGQTYTFDVHANNQYSQYGWLGDSTLALLSSSGGSYSLVAQNDDYGGSYDSHLSYTPTSSGWYSIVVGGYNNSHTGGYLLET